MEIAKRPVIADPDTEFLQKIFYGCNGSSMPPLVVNSTEKLQEILLRESHAISSLFLNPALLFPRPAPTMRAIREQLPNTPLFYILDEATASPDAADLKILTVSECLKKPFSYSDIEKALTQSLMQFDKSATLGLASNDPLLQELNESDQNFSPILAKNFLAGRESFFDLYVRIKSNKYLKILRAGDLLCQDRLDQYLRKGVVHFHIRRKMQEKYLEYCDKISSALLGFSQVPIEVQASQIINLGEETSQYLRMNGVQETAITYSLQFAKKSLELSMRLTQDESIVKHLKEATNCDHSVSVTMVASLLAAHLNIEHDRAARVVGVAAILHDVGMFHIAREIHNVDPAELTCEELDIFEAHPTIGQEMLKNISGIDPVVIQAVGQHHERRDGTGFPNKLKAGSINIVAEILGISEEYVKLLIRAQKDPSIQVMKKMERRLEGFSPSTVTTFRQLFGKIS